MYIELNILIYESPANLLKNTFEKNYHIVLKLLFFSYFYLLNLIRFEFLM